MSQYTLKNRTIPLDDSFEVIVVGGGPAGVAAATASARQGARTLLIEATSTLGGMGTLGLVPFFCGYDDGEKLICRGLAQRILEAMRTVPHVRRKAETNPFYPPAIDPELLKRTCDDMVVSVGVTVLFNTRFSAVEMDSPDRIAAVICSNKSGLVAYKAPVYIDCTGDGDLAAWAGVPFEKGEEHGGMQPASLCFALSNVDQYAATTGPGFHPSFPESPINRAIASGKYPLIVEKHSCSIQIGPGVFGFNTGHVYDVDATDPVAVSNALIQGRKMAAQYRDAFAEFSPAFANCLLASTGSLLGVRETRRILGDYVLNLDDYMARRSFPDEICRNSFGTDIHVPKAVALAELSKAEADLREAQQSRMRHMGKGESLGVPYRCLTPKGLSNLLVAGRCISTDRPVNGSIRIMPTCFNTGEAAGVAAALALRSDKNVHNVDAAKLRDILKSHGAWLP